MPTVFTLPPSPSSLLALATTVHLSLAALRNNRRPTRSPVSVFAAISFALAALPWVWPSLPGLGLGLGVHLAWFATCELLVPKAVAQAVGRPSVASVERPAARPSAPSAKPPAPRPTAEPARQQPRGFEEVPVLATFDETPTIRTIRLVRPDGFEFDAGQFVTVRIRVDGQDYVRCYSISSAPHVRGYFEISVKRQGVVSNALRSAVRPGARLAIKRPAGAFKYPAGDDRPIVLLAGGVGITPLVSMLRHAVATEPSRPVTLVYSVHGEEEIAFRDELAATVRRHPQVRVHLAASGGSTSPGVYPGRIDESLLRTTVPDLACSIAFICGPTPMIDRMKALLTELGVPSGQIRHEVFNPSQAAAAGVARETAEVSATPTARPGKDCRMVCANAGRDVPVRQGQTLLEAAEAGGVAIESLCRAGVCGTCRVQVREGDVDCQSDTLEASDQEQGFVLACVSTARTDCTVTL